MKEEVTNEIDAFGFKQKQIQINYIDRTKDVVYHYNPDTNEASGMDTSAITSGAKKHNMHVFDKESLTK